VKEPLIVHVAPDKKLESWKVIREGDKSARAKGMTKNKAVKVARKLAEKRARAIVLVHKTRYIVERSLQFS
jgi:hypothetical protein